MTESGTTAAGQNLAALKIPELRKIAAEQGLKGLSGLRKEELVSLLDEHLQKNASTLAGRDTFKEYFGRASPAKRASIAPAGATSDGEAKAKKNRAPKVKKEADGYVEDTF